MNFELIKVGFTKNVAKTIFTVKKISPELLIFGGSALFVGTIVAATKATMKLEKTLEPVKKDLELIKDLKEKGNYDVGKEGNYGKDLTHVYFEGAWKVTKLYFPTLLLGTTALSCFYGSHNIMKRRNILLVGAVKAIEESFAKYRKRVVDEFGAQKDRDYQKGSIAKETIFVDKDGKVEKKVMDESLDGAKLYTFLFDVSTSKHWVKSKGYNQMFVRGQQNFANDLLRTREHLFLNEALDALGIERVPYGNLVGWKIGKNGIGDSFVDFGVFNQVDPDPGTLAFVEEDERSVWLHFNVAGVMYHLI